MGKVIDITGCKYGRLTVKNIAYYDERKRARWLCVCDCGKEVVVRSNKLRTGQTKSCGCYNEEVRSLSGKKLGEWTKTYWGKYWDNHPDQHSKQQSAESKIRYGMIRRCYKHDDEAYKYYGARGITVCDRWLESFDNFIADMGPRPSDNHSIDRINNDGNYEPGNCRWATITQQNFNKRSNHLIECNGKRQAIGQWADEIGVWKTLITKRLSYGWNERDAVSIPVRSKRRKLVLQPI